MIAGSPRVLNALDAVGAPVAIADGVIVEAVAAMEGVDRPDDPKATRCTASSWTGSACATWATSAAG